MTAAAPKPLTIVSLESENVKRLRAVRIVPGDDSVVLIKGDNAQGKSSILDSIAYVLGGTALCPPNVIREGETSARVKLDLGEIVVSRKWTPSGSTLEVKNAEGAKYGSPQKMLDAMLGSLSFDPLAFTRERPKDQLETLRKLVGLDTSMLDKQRAELFAERTIANREVDRTKAVAASAPRYPDAPTAEVVVAELLAEQDRLVEQDRQRALQQRAVAEAEAHHARCLVTGKEIDAQIAELRTKLAQLEDRKANGEAVTKRSAEEVARAQGILATHPAADLAPVRAQLASAETTNRQVRANADLAGFEKKAAAAVAESERLTAEIKDLDEAKAEAIASAKFPVPGLGVTDDGVTFQGQPLEQASQAERIRVSLAIGLAANPRLRVLLIRDGSLLDGKALKLVAEMASAAGAQVWLERCSTEGAGGFIIEDGEVVS